MPRRPQDDNPDAYRHCECGWDGRTDDCPKNPRFGFSLCPKCRAMVGTGLAMGPRPERTKESR